MTQKANQNRTRVEKSASISLDENDKKILQIMQDDFPLVEEPWLEISNRLRIPENEVMTRIKRLTKVGVIHKIGPTFDSAKMGLKAATLIAMKVPKKNLVTVASIINQYSSVSHNYERENEYNLWFTLAAPTAEELTLIFNEIKQKTSIKDQDILNLPTLNRFKINVRFQLL
jgi:siroheme decarboxylase